MNSVGQWLIISVEAVGIVLLAIGFIHEKQIVAFEDRLFVYVKDLWRKLRK